MLPGIAGDPASQMSMGAMGGLNPKSPNPTEAMQKVDEALQVSHDLVMMSLTQIQNWNPKLSRDLHAIGQKLLAAKMDLKKEQPLGMPPDLMMGMGGATGGPPAMGPGSKPY